MRISDQEPSAEVPKANSDNVNSSEKTRKDEPSRFSRTLAKKRDQHQPNARKLGDADTAGLAVPVTEGQSRLDSSMSAARLAGPASLGLPPELQQLVREISVVVNAPGHQQVHIELNSNVLKGLHIQIERQGGAVAIQFQSASAEVSRLLSKNLDSLAQGLADRGVNVADIRVNSSQSLSSAAKYKGSGPDRRGQAGRQGQKG